MGHEQSRIYPLRGNHDFDSDNIDGVFVTGYGGDFSSSDFYTDLFEIDPKHATKPHILPEFSLIFDASLDPAFTGHNSTYEVWHQILAPLFIGSPESKPYVQQILANFFPFLKDRSDAIYEKETNYRQALLDKASEDRRAVIHSHNPKNKPRINISQKKLDGLNNQVALLKYLSNFIDQSFMHLFTPHLSYGVVSKIILQSLKANPNELMAYSAVKWGFHSSELAPLLEGFIYITRYALISMKNTKRINFQKVANSLGSISLSNSIFIPVQNSCIGVTALTMLDFGIATTASTIFSDGRNLYILSRKSTLTIVSLATTIPEMQNRAKTINLNITGKERMNLSITGCNKYILITGKFLSKDIVFQLHPFKRINNSISYLSDSFFGSPKIKQPMTSDGKYIYCLDNVKRISVFEMISTSIQFIKFIELQPGNSQLVVPFERSLILKEWLDQAVLFTNGLVFSILILRRSDHTVFSYFMRHFSLIDGCHITDVVFSLKFPILSLAIDPWNDCVWGVSANQDKTDLMKLFMSCALPPWFTGTELIPKVSYQQLCESLSESESFKSAYVCISNFLNFFSTYFFSNSFRAVLLNPQYSANTALTLAPCTKIGLKSLINALMYFKTIYLTNQRTEVITNESILSSLCSLIKLLDFNLLNFETRLPLEPNSTVFTLEISQATKIINILYSILEDKNLCQLHQVSCYVLVNNFQRLFREKLQMASKVFSHIYRKMSDDFNYFMLQKLPTMPIFPYCFSSTTCKKLFKQTLHTMSIPYAEVSSNEYELVSVFQKSICFEMNRIYSDSPMNLNENELKLQKTFLTYARLITDEMISMLDKIRIWTEENINNYPLISFFNKFLILLPPFPKYARVASPFSVLLIQLYNSISQKIIQNNLKTPIKQDKTGFTMIHFIFYQVFSLCVDSIETLLNGGNELKDTSKYSWLIRSTLESKICSQQIDEFIENIYTDSEITPKQAFLFNKGFSFSIRSGVTLQHLQEEDFIKQMIRPTESEQIKLLFNYLYENVTNRFNRRLSHEDRHFERVVFSAFMKQLGFLFEIIEIQHNLCEGQVPIMTHYTKQAMEMVYKVRMILSYSKQATQQFKSRCQEDMITTEPDSIREDYPRFRDEIFKKCIFLLHIQPCLRYQSKSFESVFADFLRRVEQFMISETTLDEYFEIITNAINAQTNVSKGLELINGILSQNSDETCQSHLIERLASTDSFLTFLSSLSDDSFVDATSSCITSIIKLMSLLSEMLSSSNMNSKIVFYLNMLMMIQKVDEKRVYKPMRLLMKKFTKIRSGTSEHNYKSVQAFIAITLLIFYEINPEILHNEKILKLMTKIFDFSELNTENLFLARVFLKTNQTPPFNFDTIFKYFQTTSPINYGPVVKLLQSMIEIDYSNLNNYYVCLKEISIICAGAESSLLSNLHTIPYVDFGSEKFCKSPGTLLSGASELIQMFRNILSLENNMTAQTINIFHYILSANKNRENYEIFDDPLLLYGVFAVLSNAINIVHTYSLAKDTETNTLYYITEINTASRRYTAWRIPITEQSFPAQVKITDTIVSIPLVPFSSKLFAFYDKLFPYYVRNLSDVQPNISVEALSFYILASMKEYFTDQRFLQQFVQILQGPITSSTIKFTDSTSDFIKVLRNHLSINVNGFLKEPEDAISFHYASPVATLSSNFVFTNTEFKTAEGMHIFISDIMFRNGITNLYFHPDLNSKFDVGIYFFSTMPNGGKALMLLAHDDDVKLLGSHNKRIKFAPKDIQINFDPTTNLGTIGNAETEEKLMTMYFQKSTVAFIVIMYGQSHASYELSSVSMKEGGNSSRSNSQRTSRSNSTKSQDGMTIKPNMPTMLEREWTRFSSTNEKSSIIEYPKSILTRIEPSYQVIVRTIELPEPPLLKSLFINDQSFVGYKIPQNYIFSHNENSRIILTKFFYREDAHFIEDTIGSIYPVKNKHHFKSRDFLLPIHPTTMGLLPSNLTNYFMCGIIANFRSEVKNDLMVRLFASPMIDTSVAISLFAPTETMLIQIFVSLLLYIEPIDIIKPSPVDFAHDTIDSNVISSNFSTYYSAINRILYYLVDFHKISSFANAWSDFLLKEFSNGYSHTIHPRHPYAVILPFNDLIEDRIVYHQGADAWLIFQSGFSTQPTDNVTVSNGHKSSEVVLANNIIYLLGSSFNISIQSRISKRSLIAIPIFSKSNQSLFGTFFDLAISFKYFILFLKNFSNDIENETMAKMKASVYMAFYDSFNARSPFFTQYSEDVIQFLMSNMPLTYNDLTKDMIFSLSVLSIYTPRDTFPFIHRFIEDQQNVLDEVYIFGGQDLFNDFFSSSEDKNSSDGSENSSKVKILTPPFPEVISVDDELPTIITKLKRLIIKRKEIHFCPFHLLIHKWAQYSHLYPSCEVTILKPTKICIKFNSNVPHQFRLIFAAVPNSIRLCYSYTKNFDEPHFIQPTAVIYTKHNNEIFLRIPDNNPPANFNNLVFYVKSADTFNLEEYVRCYRSQFVLDAKIFFIHWKTEIDQLILRCFSTKQYYRSSLQLQFNPIHLVKARINMYPLHMLCLRHYFLMILNFYYVRNRVEFGKDTGLNSLLPSVSMKIKLGRLKKLVSKSNCAEGETIRINRKAAFEVRDGQSKKLSNTLIAQLSALYVSPSQFRVASEKPWNVHLIGEQGCDVGGLARELVAEATVDLLTPACGLFIPIPDARNEIGSNQQYMIPMPNSRHHNINQQYRFAGALVAIAIRSGLNQSFNFPPLVWEFLMTQQISIERIFEIDHNFQTLISSLKQALKSGANAESTIERFNLKFVINDSLGNEVHLKQRGKEEPVTIGNCEEFISLATEFRLFELKDYLQMMSDGLWENFNIASPKYIDWQTLEFAACGLKEISFDLLKKRTKFTDVPEDQQAIFWKVVEQFSNEQRSLLLKFATGRIRFPSNVTGKTILKVDVTHGDPDRMPTASTCFNQLHLPFYTSFEKAHKLILLAIEYTGTFEIG